MPKCDHAKNDNLLICPSCGADLNPHQDEIDARDRMFPFMKSLVKDVDKENKYYSLFDRQVFDYIMSRNGARMFMWMLDMYADEKAAEKKPKKPKKKMTEMGIEMEKLEILKEIRDKL